MSDNVAQVESGKAVKLKLESIKYGEELIEALDIADNFKQQVEQYAMQLEDYKVNIPLSKIDKERRYET